ncbi:DUF192 domain-containing protein [Anabaena subtropica]|uniref:DUF192 domain-containing protein n=1 Tax=Anabaena subtropica FACHB-260 TaxID=2692884 RepID=A0ABR8CJC7_9NOST|nr:DUF192 domain-containing protein [Anabaena subtropica]MBD2343322.1 DUF192 domain-containing protein [Anabaena subtropica FACHB-260]
MMRRLTLISMLLSIFLIGCSSESTAKSPTDTASSQPAVLANTGQTLPISARAIIPNGTTIELEVARTQEQQQMGLMYRPALPDNRGMMFPFSSPQPVSFWMKNVPVALDMVFLENGVVKYIEAAAPPCAKEPCPTYGPNVPIDTVIELRSGRASELNLQPGDSIKIEFSNISN